MTQDQLVLVSSGVYKRLKDMGDGTHAEVFYAEMDGIGTSGSADSSGMVYVKASDGVLLPVDSLEVAYAGSTGSNGTFTSTVIYKDVTYVETLTFDAGGKISSKSQWEAQP